MTRSDASGAEGELIKWYLKTESAEAWVAGKLGHEEFLERIDAAN